jgi:hypothetical protein
MHIQGHVEQSQQGAVGQQLLLKVHAFAPVMYNPHMTHGAHTVQVSVSLPLCRLSWAWLLHMHMACMRSCVIAHHLKETNLHSTHLHLGPAKPYCQWSGTYSEAHTTATQ